MSDEKYSARSDGVLSLIFGIALGYFCIYRTTLDVSQGRDVIQVHGLAFLIFPLTVVQGAIYFLFGPSAEKLFGELRSPNRVGWVLRGILILLGIVLFAWFESMRIKRGYA